MESAAVSRERHRRQQLWDQVWSLGARSLTAKVVRDLGLISGAAGITRDLKHTSELAPSGVTVGFLLKGKKYADDLDDNGLVYHYPETERPGATDRNEIEATKIAQQLQLPIFVVIEAGTAREVRLGSVVTWDDEQKVFLVEFRSNWSLLTAPSKLLDEDSEPAALVPRKLRLTQTAARDSRFSMRVKQRYGIQCAVCDQQVSELIQAAHLIPHSEGGKDSALNGLPLCANHHIAFDKHLWGVDPSTLLLSSRVPSKALGITRNSLSHLPALPDAGCLTFAWERFQQSLTND